MEKKPYAAPKVVALGTVQELTLENAPEDKCAGSTDQFLPDILKPEFAGDCPTPA